MQPENQFATEKCIEMQHFHTKPHCQSCLTLPRIAANLSAAATRAETHETLAAGNIRW